MNATYISYKLVYAHHVHSQRPRPTGSVENKFQSAGT